MNYPCIVSNVGTRILMIQSVAQPNCHASLLLDQDFIAFAQFNDLKEIGFIDKRTNKQKNCPFQEDGDRIAFLTRAPGKCGKDRDECTFGDVLLNIIQVDSYATPMTF